MYLQALMLALLVQLFPLITHAQPILLKNHAWTVTDIAQTPYSDGHISRSLKSDWSEYATDEDLAHLYSYQMQRKFRISSAKVFLFDQPQSFHVAALISERGNFLALDHQEKRFLHLEDWIFQRSGRKCAELVNPGPQAIFLMQINQFIPGKFCYFMIVPGHVWQRLEIYPTSSPKDFVKEDILQACYQTRDRSYYGQDAKNCLKWFEELN